jgi:hypothetical protein
VLLLTQKSTLTIIRYLISAQGLVYGSHTYIGLTVIVLAAYISGQHITDFHLTRGASNLAAIKALSLRQNPGHSKVNCTHHSATVLGKDIQPQTLTSALSWIDRALRDSTVNEKRTCNTSLRNSYPKLAQLAAALETHSEIPMCLHFVWHVL